MRERRRVGAACRWARWVDSSDAWVQLKANKRMTYEYTPAENGQVAPMAGLDTQELAWDLTPGNRHRKVESIAQWGTALECIHESMLPANKLSMTIGRKVQRRGFETRFRRSPFGQLAFVIYASIAALTLGVRVATASTLYHYMVTPRPNASARPGSPVIRLVALNKRHFSSHDEILMKVLTSSDVVKVSNHELGHGGTLRMVSNGVFTGQGRVTGVPFFLKGMHVDMHYTATTASGATVTVTAPVTF